MKKVFLGLGSNLGDRADYLQKARIRIGESVGSVAASSSVYETEPWGFESGNEFLNMVVCVETELTASGILGRILMIESQLGRIRCETKYSSRTIDIDILLYDNEIVNMPDLKIPHPDMHQRRFVMVPITEIAPDLVHPVLGKAMITLLKECTDQGKVRKFQE